MPKDIFKYGKEGQCQPAQDVDITYNITSGPPGPPGDPGLHGDSAYQLAVKNGYVGTEAQWLASLKGATGPQGAPGRDGTAQGVKTSTVFRFYETTEANPLPPTPAGGDYNNPVPSGWSDTIPDVIAGQALFMSSRIFTDDGLPPQTPSWTTPFYAGDTEFVDFEYSLIPIDQNPGTPSTNPTVWQNGPLTGATWMAVRYKVGGVWGPWTVSSIKGEKGDQGLPGTPVETRYAVSGSPTVPPDLVNTDRTPVGWSTSSPNPATVGVGMYVWEIRAQFNPTANELIGVWSTPVRLTGTAGDPGTSRSTLTSTVFRYWEVTDLSPTPPVPLPTDGDYDNPVPTDWHDTIPPPVMGETLFMMSRIFTSDTEYPQQPSWPTPTYAGDTEFVDIEYSMVENDPGNPTDNPENWENGPLVGAWYMAIRSKVGGHWGPWTVTKIRAEQGEKGDPGAGLQFKGHVNTTGDLPTTPMVGDAYVVLTDGLLYYFNGSSWESLPWIGPEGEQGPPGNRLERRYRIHNNATSAPTLNANVRQPPGWSLSMSTPGATQYLWMTEAIIDGGSNTLIGVWSSPARETGMPGANGANGTNGNGFQIMYAAVESSENPAALPENRWTTFVPTLTNTQSLYARMRAIPPSGSPGSWSVPVKMSGRDGTGTTGPSMAYRGDWFNNKVYKGNEFVVDVVKYPAGPSGKGYIARVDSPPGGIPVGTLPTNTAYWSEFTEDIDSIFTDFLFAYSGYISNLTVGQIQTATEYERTTIGYKPSVATSDPTRNWSSHGIRQYWPSGNIMAYMGYVPNFSSDGIEVEDSWAIITWKPDGSVHFKLDSTSSDGVTYVTHTAATWALLSRANYTFTSLPNTATKTQLEAHFGKGSLTNYRARFCGYWDEINGNGSIGLKTTNSSSHYATRTPASSEPDQRTKYVTGLGGNTPVPNGWYAYLGTGMSAESVPGTQTMYGAKVNIMLPVRYLNNGYITHSHVLELTDMDLFSDTMTGTCGTHVQQFLIW